MSKILETESEGYGPSFAIHGFMRYLGLRPAQLVAYALIYSCTVDRGCYDFGAAVLADWSGTSAQPARLLPPCSRWALSLSAALMSTVPTLSAGPSLPPQIQYRVPERRGRPTTPAPIEPCTAVHLKNLHVKKLPQLQFLHVKILPHLQFFQVKPPIYL